MGGLDSLIVRAAVTLRDAYVTNNDVLDTASWREENEEKEGSMIVEV